VRPQPNALETRAPAGHAPNAVGAGGSEHAKTFGTARSSWPKASEIPLIALITGGNAWVLVSPWLFDFADEGVNAWLPFVAVGVGEIALAVATRRV